MFQPKFRILIKSKAIESLFQAIRNFFYRNLHYSVTPLHRKLFYSKKFLMILCYFHNFLYKISYRKVCNKKLCYSSTLLSMLFKNLNRFLYYPIQQTFCTKLCYSATFLNSTYVLFSKFSIKTYTIQLVSCRLLCYLTIFYRPQ